MLSRGIVLNEETAVLPYLWGLFQDPPGVPEGTGNGKRMRIYAHALPREGSRRLAPRADPGAGTAPWLLGAVIKSNKGDLRKHCAAVTVI